MQKLFIPSLLALSLSLILPVQSARADGNTTIPSDTDGNTYNVGPGNTFTVDSGKTLSLGTGDNAIITVDNAGSTATTINNLGTIDNDESITDEGSNQNARVIQIKANDTPIVNITNGSATDSAATLESAGSDVIHAKTGTKPLTSEVSIYNYGTINAENTGATSNAGQQAIDFNNQTAGSLLVDNYNTGTIEAYESDPIQVPLGGTITINNDGLILGTRAANTTGSVDGINGETTSGQIINNGMGIGGETVTNAEIIGAHHGITADGSAATSTWTMSVTNGVNGTIQGNDGSGINIDGVPNGPVVNGVPTGKTTYENVTITNHGLISGNGKNGDGDGVDVDGLVNLDNFGTIQSLDAYQDASEGVTVGGGTIKNEAKATIIGYNTSHTAGEVGVGITLAGIDKNPTNNAAIPVQTIYGTTTVDNAGLIQGQTGAGIQATSQSDQYNITITNEATGTIEGGGTTSAAVQMDGVAGQIGSTVANKVINYGTITADASGKAIDLGAGTNEVDIEGGAAHVNGSISGGTGSTNSVFKVDAGSGNSFVYSGAISNFTTLSVASGTFNLNGSIAGGTTTIQNGGTLSGNNSVGALVIAAGGTLSPGNSPGKTTATSAVLNPTGNFLLQVDNDGSTGAASAGTNWDQLAVTGTVDISALSSSNQFVFQLQSLNSLDKPGALASFDHDVSHVWADVITSTDLATTGAFSSSDFSVDTSLFDETLDGTFSIQQDAADANDLDLVYTAAPEPSTWALLFSGAGLLAAFARFRNRLV